MKRIEESTQFLKDHGMAGWLADIGGGIARGIGKIGKGAIDKPLKTAAIYGTTAAIYPGLAISSLAAPEPIKYGLKRLKKVLVKLIYLVYPLEILSLR